MNQTSVIAGSLVLAFIVFITVRGELPCYMQVLGISTGASCPVGSSCDGGSSTGGALSSAASSALGFSNVNGIQIPQGITIGGTTHKF